jgi:hypothetical protein
MQWIQWRRAIVKERITATQSASGRPSSSTAEENGASTAIGQSAHALKAINQSVSFRSNPSEHRKPPVCRNRP